MLPTIGAAKIFVVLLLAISIIQSKENKIMNDMDGLYDENYKMYAPANMIRLARFYTFYDKPSLKDDFPMAEGILDKRRDRPRPMRFGK